MGCCSSQPVNLQDVYEVNEKIGAGAFGQVRSCKHRKNGEIRAVKVILKEEEGVSLEELMEEIYIMRCLDHKYIIKLHDFFEDDKFLYCVMDKYTGGELFQKLKSLNQVQMIHIVRYIVEMVEAVRYLETVAVVHRDIKPENFLFKSEDDDSPLCMIDFGLSQRIGPEQWVSACCGTVQYLSPEMIKGRYRFTGDMWAVGVICYLLLVGSYPFSGSSDSKVMHEIIHKDPLKNEKLNRVPKAAVDFLRRILNKDPQTRITPDAALAHQWLTTPTVAEESAPKVQVAAPGTAPKPVDMAAAVIDHNTIASAMQCVAESKRVQSVEKNVGEKEAQRDQVFANQKAQGPPGRRPSLMPPSKGGGGGGSKRRVSKLGFQPVKGDADGFSDLSGAVEGGQAPPAKLAQQGSKGVENKTRRPSMITHVLDKIKPGHSSEKAGQTAIAGKVGKSKFRDEKLEAASLTHRKANSIGGDQMATQIMEASANQAAAHKGIVNQNGKIRARTFSVQNAGTAQDQMREEIGQAFKRDLLKHQATFHEDKDFSKERLQLSNSQRSTENTLNKSLCSDHSINSDMENDNDTVPKVNIAPPTVALKPPVQPFDPVRESDDYGDEERDGFDPDALGGGPTSIGQLGGGPSNAIFVTSSARQIDEKKEGQMDDLFEKQQQQHDKNLKTGGFLGAIASGSKRVIAGLTGSEKKDHKPGRSSLTGKDAKKGTKKVMPQPQLDMPASGPSSRMQSAHLNNLAAQFRDDGGGSGSLKGVREEPDTLS